MKVYNETWLQNRYAIELAKRLQEEAILNSEQLESIKKLHAAIPILPIYSSKCSYLFLDASVSVLVGHFLPFFSLETQNGVYRYVQYFMVELPFLD